MRSDFGWIEVGWVGVIDINIKHDHMMNEVYSHESPFMTL
jgi:hypothetical protein